MKKRFLAILTLVALLLLPACSSSGSSDSSSSSSSTTTATGGFSNPESSVEMGVDTVVTQFSDDVKLVYTGDLTIETTDFEDSAQALYDTVNQYEGYFSSSDVSSYSQNYRWGSYTVRLPSEHYYAFQQALGELCHITRTSTTVEDISEVYYDTQGRLETQEIKLERLQSLLEQAENMEDIITIESAISDTQWQIDSLSGEMRHYDSIVDYATIEIYLDEVYQLSTVQEAPKTFGERIGNGLTQGGENFVDGLEDLVVGLAYNWAGILVIAVIVVAGLTVRRRIVKKLKAKNERPPADKL